MSSFGGVGWIALWGLGVRNPRETVDGFLGKRERGREGVGHFAQFILEGSKSATEVGFV